MVPVWPKCSTPSERVRWPMHRAEPGERRRMPVETVTRPQWGGTSAKQPFDMARGMHEAALAGPLRRGPAGIEPVGRGHREKADIAPILGDQPDRFDGFGRHSSGIGDDDLGVRPGPAQPIGAVDDVVAQRARRSRAAAARASASRGADRPSRPSRRAASSVRSALPRPSAADNRRRSARSPRARRRRPARRRRARPGPAR